MLRISCLVALLAITLTLAARADDAASSAFERLKALAGSWQSEARDEQGNPQQEIEFKVVAQGSAVVETMFPGKPYEMVNVYTLDGDRILITHYCAGGNQPRMAAPAASGAVIEFKVVDVTGLKDPAQSYMGSLKLDLSDPAVVVANWATIKQGEDAKEYVSFRLVRKS
jgi:hypothetical protein